MLMHIHTHIHIGITHVDVHIHIHKNLTTILLVSEQHIYGNGILLFWVHLIELLPIPRRKR